MVFSCARNFNMTDAKYLDLPGIARDQPDVYETSDLPESDQAAVNLEETSDSVEKIVINTEDVFKKFKDKVLDPSSTDFSDRISRKRQRGYDIRSGVWEISEDKENETTIQRYQRLKCEFQQFIDDVSKTKEEDKETANKEKDSIVDVKAQMEDLQKQLVEMKLEEMLGSSVIENLSDPQGALHKKLINQIENFSFTEAPKKTDSEKSQPGNLSYELFYHPEQAKFEKTAVVASLEQRLEVLESLVGSQDNDKLQLLFSHTKKKSLMGCSSLLAAKLSLLDPQHLDQIEGRLGALITKLDALKEKKSVIEGAENLAKINELYDVAKESEKIYADVPHISERMLALQGLHDQALQFSKALSHLDSVQQQLTCGIKEHKKLLTEVTTNLQSNMDTIKKNLATLESRMTQLK